MSTLIAYNETHPSWKAINAFRAAWDAKEFHYGTTIPREWLEHAIGISISDELSPDEQGTIRGQWMKYTGDFRTYLLHELKIMTTPSTDPPGFYIVPAEKQTELAVNMFVRDVTRANRRASNVAENTNVDVMTPEQKRQSADHLALLRRLQVATQTALVTRGGEASKIGTG